MSKDKLFGLAIGNNNISEVNRLISEGVDVNKDVVFKGLLESPLHHATSMNYDEIVKILIAAGANVNNPRDGDNVVPLHIAVQNNNMKIVKLLIAAGANVNKAAINGGTPISIAAFFAFYDIAKYLIDKGANVNQPKTSGGNTPLHLVVDAGYINMIKLFVESGANVNAKNKKGERPIDLAKTDKIRNLLQTLIKSQTINNVKLIIAINSNNINEINALIASGIDINKPIEDNGRTPLYIASEKGNKEIVELFIRAGADVNKPTTNGATPLYVACEKAHIHIIQLLIAANADVDKAKTDINVTPLYYATNIGNKEIVELLINAGADINKTSMNFNATPVYNAVLHNHKEIVELLIDAGADINKATTDNNLTPLLTACNLGYTEIVKLLINANADINFAISNTDTTALMIASYKGYKDIVELLVAAGADITKENKRGETAFDVAKTEEIRSILKESQTPQINQTFEESNENENFNINKWQGFSQNDVSALNDIFGDETTAKNISVCPVCLKYVKNSDNCYYMKHNCSESGGYYHKELYNKYKNNQDMIHWCTVCGRICADDAHYRLGLAKNVLPRLIHSQNTEIRTCESDGGGGILEKLSRFRRLREHAKDLQDYIGKIDFEEAMDELCEEVWNAPLMRSHSLPQMLESKKFNFPNSNFPGINVSNTYSLPSLN